MKTYTLAATLMLCAVVPPQRLHAQAQEIEQLVLNIEKLLQFRQMLADVKAGYTVLSQAYELVKHTAEGNFTLHQAFLDGLLQVNPAVKRYERVADIVRMQAQLVNAYRSGQHRFAASGLFSDGERKYLKNVYAQLLKSAAQYMADLTEVLTAGRLRISDDERLAAIDRIHANLQEELTFVRRFNQSTGVLLVQRTREAEDVRGFERMYGR